ncbi:hypothetical protein N9838_00615 [Acidimicrobiia bacterium]|nr:hypothetical protein [Acidimicrobiia bacterium]
MIKKYRLAALFLLGIFLLSQTNYLFSGGSTFDELAIDNGNVLVFEKLKTILNGEILEEEKLNPVFEKIHTNETYGQFVSFQQFYFSRIFNSLVLEGGENIFTNNISDSYLSKTFFGRFFYLNIYSCVILFLLFLMIEKSNTPKFSLLFLILFLSIPSINGHLLFNQKDGAFMLHFFLFCIYLLSSIKNKSVTNNLILGLLAGIVISLRLSSLIFIFFTYLFLFFKEQRLTSFSKREFCNKYLQINIYSILFYFVLSPSAWFTPLEFIQISIDQQILLNWTGSTLTNGNFILANDISPWYLVTWLFYKLPLIIHISLFIFLVRIKTNLRNDIVAQFSFYFLIISNIFFIVYRPPVYDGLRHFLFLIPFIAYLSLKSLYNLTESKHINFVILISSIVYLSFTQFGLSEYRYIYLNEFVEEESISGFCEDNIDGCGDWLADYWGFSGRKLASYINENDLENVVYCKTVEIWQPYTNESLSPLYGLNIKTYPKVKDVEKVLVATLYRPRYDTDSCFFKKQKISYSCEPLYSSKAYLRGTEVSLNFLNSCELTNVNIENLLYP